MIERPTAIQSRSGSCPAGFADAEEATNWPSEAVGEQAVSDAADARGEKVARAAGWRSKAASSPDWDGVMIGPYVVDITIFFRVAYAAEGPARLAKHIDLMFGPEKGLYVDHWKRTRQVGLSYEPQYVLNADEVTSLMGGAFHIIKQARSALTQPSGKDG